jgi:hypothetical protein
MVEVFRRDNRTGSELDHEEDHDADGAEHVPGVSTGHLAYSKYEQNVLQSEFVRLQ